MRKKTMHDLTIEAIQKRFREYEKTRPAPNPLQTDLIARRELRKEIYRKIFSTNAYLYRLIGKTPNIDNAQMRIELQKTINRIKTKLKLKSKEEAKARIQKDIEKAIERTGRLGTNVDQDYIAQMAGHIGNTASVLLIFELRRIQEELEKL